MFGIGHGFELIIVVAIGLIILGPGKFPEMAQTVGKMIRELRKATSEIQQTFDVNALMNPPEPAAPPAPEPPIESVPMVASEAVVIPEPTIHQPELVATIIEEPVAKPKRSRKRPATETADLASESTALVALPAPEADTPSRARKRTGATRASSDTATTGGMLTESIEAPSSDDSSVTGAQAARSRARRARPAPFEDVPPLAASNTSEPAAEASAEPAALLAEEPSENGSVPATDEAPSLAPAPTHANGSTPARARRRTAPASEPALAASAATEPPPRRRAPRKQLALPADTPA